ncbi:MAG: type II restriction endonuclease subunit M, partial [Candidatus Paceibacterota bacterium]
MAVLTSQQRSILEKAVVKARNTAEEGAINSLKNLAVDQPEPFMHQSREQRALRNNLRAKARLLGDVKLPNGSHEIQNLAYELAYEYWHKILFARFLEANNLLMHPTMGVAVTLEELEELASEEGYADKWEAASTYASHMLPAIFRVGDPLMQITFAPNDRIALESILNALEPEIFTADDALGWVYQFWQSEAKAAINASGDKIDGKRLPAVTQLFTEPYMVNFLIDNTIGAWWVSRNPGVTPPYRFEYLRTLEDGTPAAGKFEGWPDKTAEVTSLDPCMGSGHFVCSLFNVFAALRMHEEGLTKEQATDRVIAENLHGLEIDPRCTQIAAFNLALTAWKFCGHYKELPEMNLACSGIAPKGKVEDWMKLVGNVENENDRYRMENGMRALYDHFQLAPELGSLLDPTTIKADAFTASFDQLQPVLKKALENERDNEVLERGIMAAGIAKAGEILVNNYNLVITNVPYLGVLKYSDILREFIDKYYDKCKNDLAFVFIERLKKTQCNERNTYLSLVSPQGWLFQSRERHFRKQYLLDNTFHLMARLGSGAFQEISGEVVQVLLSISSLKKLNQLSNYIYTIDLGDVNVYSSKFEMISTQSLQAIRQHDQINNKDSIIDFSLSGTEEYVGKYCSALRGLSTGETNWFIRFFWELGELDSDWEYFLSTVDREGGTRGRAEIIYWQNEEGIISQIAEMMKDYNHSIQSWRRGKPNWGKYGIVINSMSTIRTSVYLGEIYSANVGVIIAKKESYKQPLWHFFNSQEFQSKIKKLNQKLSIEPRYFEKVKFNFYDWKNYANENKIDGLSFKLNTIDCDQWHFHGNPTNCDQALQVAMARLLGYRWPAESDEEMELSDEARDLIKQVKELYLPFDEDGIVCIPPVYSEQQGSERLRQLLQKTWGDNWNNTVLAELLKQAGAKNNNLEDWLRNEFFSQHCKVFKNRPFIWHIWDGRKDGFSALVNYHKLDKETLKKLIYTYLGDWIRQCEAKLKSGESGADGLLSAALKLKEKLELILGGEQ